MFTDLDDIDIDGLDEGGSILDLDEFEDLDGIEQLDDFDDEELLDLEGGDFLDDLDGLDGVDELDGLSESTYQFEGGGYETGWDGIEGLEFESDYETDFEGLEFEFDEFGEDPEFFKKLFRGVGRLIKKGARFIGKNFKRLFKVLAPVAAKIVGTAIGGPAGAAVATAVTNAVLKEAEESPESEEMIEAVLEDGDEAFLEAGGDLDAIAEMEDAATEAAEAVSERDADEAIARMVRAIPRLARSRKLRRWIPRLQKAAAALAKTLRLNRKTRWAVKLVPLIMRRAVMALLRQRRITARSVVIAVAHATAWVLANPRRARAATRHRRRVVRRVRSRRRPSSRRRPRR